MGTAIMAAGTDASAYANNYLPPVTGPLAWANLESDLLPAGRRLKNFGSLGGTFALSGIAQLVAKGVAAAAGTESRLTLGTTLSPASPSQSLSPQTNPHYPLPNYSPNPTRHHSHIFQKVLTNTFLLFTRPAAEY